MKKEQIRALFARFERAAYLFEGIECWSARDLQEILGYSEWRNFNKTVDKAKEACTQGGESIGDHFVEVNKMVELGSGALREVEDIALTRYACYLVAQNGDPGKPEVAFAQTYFAVQTRKQELIEKRLLDVARVVAREKLSQSEKKLSSIIYERGVHEQNFAVIRSAGDHALFGGRTTNAMKKKLQIPDTRPLADFLPTLTIKPKTCIRRCMFCAQGGRTSCYTRLCQGLTPTSVRMVLVYLKNHVPVMRTLRRPEGQIVPTARFGLKQRILQRN